MTSNGNGDVNGSWDPQCHPNLKPGNFEVTSKKNKLYNCIAWAAEVVDKFYWPQSPHWPAGIRNENDIQSFVEFYRLFGYDEECKDGEHEVGYDKVVIFASEFGSKLIPTHATRQLPDGSWTSKLGKVEDIGHKSLKEVEEGLYGKPVCYLKRKRNSSKKSL